MVSRWWQEQRKNQIRRMKKRREIMKKHGNQTEILDINRRITELEKKDA